MKKIIIDCDNTLGVSGCDIDDGLAIIYAFGRGNCEVLGVTTTFGNSGVDVTYSNTVKFMKSIGRADVPVLEGHKSDERDNKAAEFLADTINKYPGKISVLATGSLTNLYHAYLLDNDIYKKIDEISIMGGVTEPLIICGEKLGELNFSCSYEAAYNVLTNGCSIKIATGNNCLAAFFTRERFDVMGKGDNDFLRWLCRETQYWFDREKEAFGHDGIYKWDVYAAAALLTPELFNCRKAGITPDLESLKTGRLFGKGTIIDVCLPEIIDPVEYIGHVYETYSKFQR